MEINGKVMAVLTPREFDSQKGKDKIQTIIIEYMSGDYPQKLALTNIRNSDDFGKIPVGATGTFYVNPRSRESKGNWYTEVNCYNWRINSDRNKNGNNKPSSN